MFYKYPFTKQEAMKDCAPASLQMIIKYYKGYVGIEKLRDLMRTDKLGTNAYNIIEAAKELGFEASGVRTSLEDLNCDNLILPAIAHVIINNSYTHFVVIYKIDYKKKIITIADPADKIKKLTFEEFNKIWTNVLIILYPITNIVIEQNIKMSTFIFNVLKNHKKLFISIILLSLFILLFSVISSFYFQIMIDYTYNNKLIQVFLIFLTFILLKAITTLFRTETLIILKQKIDFSLTLDTIKHMIYLPYQYYKTRSTGDVISRINDMESIKDILNKGILTILIEIPLAIISLIILFIFNTKLFSISLIIILLYLFLSLVFRRIFNKFINDYQCKKANVSTCMVESIQGFETIKGLNIQKNIINLLELKYSKLLSTIYKLEKKYNIQNFLKDLINESGTLITILLGIFLIKDNIITLGMLITFNTLSSYFLEPMKDIIDLDYNFKEAKCSLKRIAELFHNYEIKELNNTNIDGNIKISNLFYSYNGLNNILEDINLDIPKGDKLLILGSSGSGKSTLLKLIMKYYEIRRNKIYIDDLDINDINTNDIVYISQNEMLFTDSLINNLKLNRNIDYKEITGACKLCYVEDIIKNNNLGLNMLIEENGFNLSGGEKQRIVLTRSLLQNFEILLIDEGLNQVDINLERKILKNLFLKYKDKTIIIISHRHDNMDLFNHVVELDNGVIRKDLKKC